MPRLIHREKRAALGKLYATPEEEERIRAAAERAGVPLMRWAREMLLAVATMQELQEARRAVE